MAKKIKRGRGRPRSTGKGELVGLRCHKPFLHAVDNWRDSREDKPSRPAAIARLAEMGLAASASARPHSAKTRAKAAELAAETIDRHTDQSAPPEEQASRKRRLLKGPKEFRDLRKDHK
jgi:hypothetical protein